MDLSKLVKDSGYHSREWINEEGEGQLKKIFGLRTAANSRWEYFKQQYLLSTPEVIRSEEIYTREEIASTLFRHNLVGDLEEGLCEADVLIEKGIGRSRFVKNINPQTGDVKYRLEVTRPLLSTCGL